ncbi:MAG: hypothetical protein QMD71_09720 [bacterium]|nr:hypothetical protein [bacterium]
MARPLVEVKIRAKKLNGVLDTGSRKSYIISELAEGCPIAPVITFEVKLGREILSIKEGLFLALRKIRKIESISSVMFYFLLKI